MKILLTGFEPFDQERVNPSWEAVRRAEAPEGADLIRSCLPVSFRAAPRQLEALIRQHRPDVVLCVGQAGGRSGISLERVAVNLMDARIPDNDGFQPEEEPLVSGGETAYFSTLPLRRMETALRVVGLSVQISNTAGLYVCNTAFYTAARLAAQEFPGQKTGFVHVPYLPEQSRDGKYPSMPLEDVVRALEECLQCLAEGQNTAKV